MSDKALAAHPFVGSVDAARSTWDLRVKRIAGNHAAVLGTVLLCIALVIGLATAHDYGATIDEFNANDYGPKALAWYLSGFADHSQFETVEPPLWYYGPWFQMLTAAVQSLGLADALTVRHAMTFLIGLAGLAALLPMARFSFGGRVGPIALAVCLLTGYLYGNLFFAPIDAPFLAAMCWATLAIMIMGRQTVPSWRATACVGAATGLAIATRTGGIITHAYLFGVLGLCALEALVLSGSAARKALLAIAVRGAAAILLAWLVAIALWPWLQIGNPFAQFATAYAFFAKIPTRFEFVHWGQTVVTTALPWSYIPEQWLARFPIGFLAALAAAVCFGIADAIRTLHLCFGDGQHSGNAGVRAFLLQIARRRSILLVWVAAAAPILFLMVEHATLYDGVRHTLFVIPMLALLAGWAIVRLCGSLRLARSPAALLMIAYAAALIANLVRLHPLEYIAMNPLAGGVAGAYERFDLDYWSASATEALRRLEARLDQTSTAERPTPSILICIPYREHMIEPMLGGKWRLELDRDKADFVIETERSRCAADDPDLVLVDKVTRAGRAFAWTFVNRQSRFFRAMSPATE